MPDASRRRTSPCSNRREWACSIFIRHRLFLQKIPEGAELSDEWTEMVDTGFIELVGPIFMSKAENGVHRFRFTAEQKHKNRVGFVHGGMLMAFADRCL